MSMLGGFLMPHPPIVIHEVGRGREKESQITVDGMHGAAEKIAELKPETIVLITPHGPTFTDAVAIYDEDTLKGDLGKFGATSVKYEKTADTELVDEIVFTCHERNIPVARIDDELVSRFNLSRELDHGAVVPLQFIENEYSDYKLICISYGFLDHEMLYRFGQVIQSSADMHNRKTVIVASGDLSHRLKNDGPYQYHPDGEVFDNELLRLFREKKFSDIILMDSKLCDNAGECGKRSIDVMLGALDGYNRDVEIYSYEGPFGVGYGVVGLYNLHADNTYRLLDAIQQGKRLAYEERLKKEDPYVRLARQAIEAVVRREENPKIPELIPKEMLENRGGTFVSIKTSSGLRGCMGTIAGTQINIAEEIIENAIKAATGDPRFPEIEPSELSGLIISVDVLSKAEKVEDIAKLDPKKYGVIVTSGYRRGLLLPDLKGIDTIQDQIDIALNKAGIRKDEEYTVERFTVSRHE